MAGILSAITTIASTTVKTAESGMSLIDTIGEINKKDVLVQSKGSITKFLSPYIVEPIVIATKGAKEQDIFERVVNMNTDVFCSFYLQAFELLNNIHNIDAQTIVDFLSTDKGGMLNFIKVKTNDIKGMAETVGGVAMIPEFVKAQMHSLGRLDNYSVKKIDEFNYLAVLESKNKHLSLSMHMESSDQTEETEQSEINMSKFTDDKEMTQSLYAGNLRQLKITVNVTNRKDGKKDTHSYVIPITVRTHVLIIDVNDIINSLSPKSRDKSFSSRFMDWRAGSISFKDLVLCSDLIKEYKANRIKDGQSFFNMLQQKEISSASMKGDKFEKYYNMYILTKDDKHAIDKYMRGDIQNEKYKQDFLTQGMGLGLTIIDPDYERVEFSIKDIRGTSNTSFKNLEKRKHDQNDFDKIMQALLMNRPMAF